MTELLWEGKYDKDGRKVAPLRVALPFQTVETVNESMVERQRTLDLFTAGRDVEWRNRLIWGDKKYVLPALLGEFAGKVDLVYVDPPFATGQDFSLPVSVNGESFTREPSMIEVKAYRDTWGGGLDSYVRWSYEMISAFHALLSETGSLYVHVDPGVSHMLKLVLDEVFGPGQFRNEIIWKRTSAHSSARKYGPVHEVLLFYTKSDRYKWKPQFEEYGEFYLDQFYTHTDEAGRRWRRSDLTAAGIRRGETGQPWRGIDVTAKGRHWFVPPRELDQLDEQGRIHWPQKAGGMPMLRRYHDEQVGIPLQDVWVDIKPIHNLGSERTDYPTQKPEALLRRLIAASTGPDDLVLDCVCGSGTTPAAAEKLGRRWIAADLSRFAVHTTRKRLLSVPDVRPFVVQNLGKYERQLWQAAEFGEEAQARTEAYRRFILEVYKAKPIAGYAWLHGVRQGRMVHVGTVDAPVTVGDVKQIAAEFGRAMGTGADAPATKAVDVLGWDFAFELNELAKQTAERAGIDVRFLRIPREVLDKRAVEQGDIRFFELAALDVEVQRKGRAVTLNLSDFMIPTDDVPEDVQRAITDWAQWIDYWAVDWDNKGDTFHNEWQTYRTRKEPGLQKSACHEYEAPGAYQVVVKVIDILGNDTTKTLKVEVP
jgi:DNA modification methylase